MKKCAIMAALVLALSACVSAPAPVTNSTDNGNSINPNDECPRADGTPCR